MLQEQHQEQTDSPAIATRYRLRPDVTKRTKSIH